MYDRTQRFLRDQVRLAPTLEAIDSARVAAEGAAIGALGE